MIITIYKASESEMALPSPQIYINVESPLPPRSGKGACREGDRHSAILISDFCPLVTGLSISCK